MDDMTFRNGHPPPVDPPRSPRHIPEMDNERLAKLEGAYDSLKVVRPMTLAVLGLFLATLVFVLGFMANQIRDVTSQVHDLNAKVDAIPAQLREEFRAMRAEMAAQTSAIANSITATRQVQPQILVLPPTPQAPTK